MNTPPTFNLELPQVIVADTAMQLFDKINRHVKVERHGKLIRIHCAGVDREAVMPQVRLLKKHKSVWQFALSGPSPEGRFVARIEKQAIVEPAAQACEVTSPTWARLLPDFLQSWLRALGLLPPDLHEPEADLKEVTAALEAAVTDKFRTPVGADTELLSHLTIKHTLKSWSLPLQRLAPTLQRQLMSLRSVRCAPKFDVVVELVMDSLAPDAIDTDLLIELHFVNELDDLVTAPPAGNYVANPTQPKNRRVSLTLSNGSLCTKGEIDLDHRGMLSFARVPGAALDRLLGQINSRSALSRDPAKSLELQIEDLGAKVLNAGERQRFFTTQGQALQMGQVIAFPVAFTANMVRFEVAQCTPCP